MRVIIAAVGRARPGPEAELTRDYLARATQAGRSMALGPCDLVEIDERKARDRAAQSVRLLDAAPTGAHLIALDERGRTMTSPEFAAMLARLRDSGTSDCAFLIGGADGHDESLRGRADRLLSFGPMVWPHMLARAMLAEQIYRAVSILAGSPYHRE
ncbi:23S rRNA (pseudouridine(1915)-N(3))-methyltransferase RlmH [Limibaculum sp. M0105]|uniref:Ribosomal RNA large subunit methyltransferase H n=1 Tax=Thermohalobaculum xanthum TaxID=2753746 RepID=A0A8J7MBL6_9RHOB|nr:23S rRNA (pseudouridine(1915)-N(3))-methyltransferase RlmH [Thermohalobaculum xanthum]MBK0401257.1 23S rRNA (pseudouridine(1915)-N(3))-methyltransferase RlmH [Thermohalobaculum xanthum]